ncbi:MAG: RNA polymerase sigma factor [Candidatus Kapaibacterium sp.]|nr:RNA polymerase sigma factor [Bacteroidota bacterium]
MEPDSEIQQDKNTVFISLLNPVYDNLYRFVRALSYNREDALDLLHDTLLTAYEQFESLQNNQAFLSWLFTIASRKHKRNQFRKKILSWIVNEKSNHVSQNYHDTDAEIELLYFGLSHLPLKVKEALILSEINGFSLKEIQDIQGGSLSGVKSRVARGKQKLREVIEKEVKQNLIFNNPDFRL